MIFPIRASRFFVRGSFCYDSVSVKPPDLAQKNQTEDIDDPEEGNASDNQNNGKNDTQNVLFHDTAAQSVNCPNDVKEGKGKNNLDDHRKIVDAVNQFLHKGTPFM